MTLVRANPIGWGLFELLTSSQINQIDSQLPFAVDGRGGTYASTDELELDGSAVSATDKATLRLLGTVNGSALFVQSSSSTAYAVQIHRNDPTANFAALLVSGGDADVAGEADNAMQVSGSDNAGGDGGDAIFLVGGDTTFVDAQGGSGMSVTGGSALDTGYGGYGLIASAGFTEASAITSSQRFGVAGALVTGGTINAGNAADTGGEGVRAHGGSALTLGRGGLGLLARGGYGPSVSETGSDVGTGALGMGTIGVWGIGGSRDANYRPPDAEFVQNARAGVRAMAKGAGKAFLSEFSGITGDSDSELNAFYLVGTYAPNSSREVISVQANAANSVATTTYITGIRLRANSNVKNFQPAVMQARQQAAMLLSTSPGSGNTNQHLHIAMTSPLVFPTQSAEGEMGYLQSGLISGLIGGALFVNNGVGIVDRVVTSLDSGAVYSSCRITTNGSGGYNITNRYNAPSGEVDGPGGAYQLRVFFDTFDNQPTDLSLVAVACSNKLSGLGGSHKTGFCAAALLDGGVGVAIMMWDQDGVSVDFTTAQVDISVIVTANYTGLRPAQRPTYKRFV